MSDLIQQRYNQLVLAGVQKVSFCGYHSTKTKQHPPGFSSIHHQKLERICHISKSRSTKEASERGMNGTLKELEASEAEMDRLVSPRFFTSHSFMTGRQRESHTHDVHAGKLKAKWKKVLWSNETKTVIWPSDKMLCWTPNVTYHHKLTVATEASFWVMEDEILRLQLQLEGTFIFQEDSNQRSRSRCSAWFKTCFTLGYLIKAKLNWPCLGFKISKWSKVVNVFIIAVKMSSHTYLILS